MRTKIGLEFLLITALIATSSFLVVGCDSLGDRFKLGQLQQDIKDGIDAAKKHSPSSEEIQGVTKSTVDELSKLFAIEYRVIELDKALSTATLEAVFNKLGEERWDCFHTDVSTDKRRLFCKRFQRAYILHLLKLFGLGA